MVGRREGSCCVCGNTGIQNLLVWLGWGLGAYKKYGDSEIACLAEVFGVGGGGVTLSGDPGIFVLPVAISYVRVYKDNSKGKLYLREIAGFRIL
jgi:hypothetical protein